MGTYAVDIDGCYMGTFIAESKMGALNSLAQDISGYQTYADYCKALGIPLGDCTVTLL